MACNKCQECNPCSQTTPCVQETCACAVFLEDTCITITEDLVCSGILKAQTLSEVLKQLDAYICERFGSVEGFFKLVNVGTGAEIYKGISILGEKEIKSIKGTSLIDVTNLADEVEVAINEAALTAFIEEVAPTPNFQEVTDNGNVTTNTFYRDNDLGESLAYFGVLDRVDVSSEDIIGVRRYHSDDPIENYNESIGFTTQSGSEGVFIEYVRRDDTIITSGYDKNLLFSLPLKHNPSYPTHDEYTLATISYTVYTILLNETLVPIVLENTFIDKYAIPTFTWTNADLGIYELTLSGAGGNFVTNKTFCTVSNLQKDAEGTINYMALRPISTSKLELSVINTSGANHNLDSGYVSIEVRVYN
jgi:hypothetical protein